MSVHVQGHRRSLTHTDGHALAMRMEVHAAVCV